MIDLVDAVSAVLDLHVTTIRNAPARSTPMMDGLHGVDAGREIVRRMHGRHWEVMRTVVQEWTVRDRVQDAAEWVAHDMIPYVAIGRADENGFTL
jgi:hypothetical protein